MVLVDLNDFFLQSFEKCIILTPDIGKQPQTLESLKKAA